jgi:PAT family beta-lactamase induction signal transducer AmpG
VAFVSASQDVVIDAYRTDLLPAAERGLGASLNVMGYRLAMIVSGGVTLIWTDPQQGSGWDWPAVYRLMALLMAGAAVLSATLLPRLAAPRSAAGRSEPVPSARQDLVGFGAVVLAVALGAWLSDRYARGVAQALIGGWLQGTTLPVSLQGRWIDLLALLLGIGLTLPLAAWAARRARFVSLLDGLRTYFSQPGAAAFLLFIVLYKLGVHRINSLYYELGPTEFLR